MVFIVAPYLSAASAAGKHLLFRSFFFVLLALLGLPSIGNAKARPKIVTEPTQVSAAPNPDLLLIETLKNIAKNDLRAAEISVNLLIENYPHFQLAYLLRGDLLLMHTRPITNLGSGTTGSPEKLKDLRQEASVRIQAMRFKPDPDLIPRSILQLRDDQKQIFVIDAKRSRLYVYRNIAGQPKFVADYYVSQGRFGINKTKEGDQRTPIGVYYITSRLPGSKLPDFYGPGALPLNYPNEWDKLNGRNGSGIWLHGVPSSNYSRPPLASDGCVVLANVDFLKLSSLVETGITPVIISESVEFVNRAKWFADKLIASKFLDDWRNDLESQSAPRLLANYSKKFKSMQGENAESWINKQPPIDRSGAISVKLNEITQFRYPGNADLIVSTFTQEIRSRKINSNIRKRQYWIKEATKWRIIFEAQI